MNRWLQEWITRFGLNALPAKLQLVRYSVAEMPSWAPCRRRGRSAFDMRYQSVFLSPFEVARHPTPIARGGKGGGAVPTVVSARLRTINGSAVAGGCCAVALQAGWKRIGGRSKAAPAARRISRRGSQPPSPNPPSLCAFLAPDVTAPCASGAPYLRISMLLKTAPACDNCTRSFCPMARSGARQGRAAAAIASTYDSGEDQPPGP